MRTTREGRKRVSAHDAVHSGAKPSVRTSGSLRRLCEDDPRIADYLAQENDHVVDLAPGWQHKGAHSVFGETERDVLKQLREVERCGCEACALMMRAMGGMV